ncbi:MAG: Do family serine endopeptidase [bacterium]|nr:Do family serine endopeptidase [bacterium]
MLHKIWLRRGYDQILVVCGLLGLVAVGIGTGTAETGRLWKEKTFSPAAEVNRELAVFIALAKDLSPAVVNISTVQKTKRRRGSFFRGFRSPFQDRYSRQADPFQEFFERFFGDVPPEARQSLGSGFIVNANGLIITNNHVVEEADKIKVTLLDKRELDAEVVGRDAKTDLALIKVRAEDPLPTVPLGDSDRLQIGEWVMAIGNPFGLSHTVTAGIVSAKGRVIGAGQYDDFIQTDASINPGNSGGPLFNTRGEVVGVNTAIIAGGSGIGFAIAVNLVKELLPQLFQNGRVTRGWLGVMIQKVTPELARSFNLPKPQGALLVEVIENSPAARGGLQQGDIVTTFGGVEIDDLHDLPRAVANTPVGKEVKIEILRQGKASVHIVTVIELKEETSSPFAQIASPLGMRVEALTPERAQRMGVAHKVGVVVVEVDARGVAAAAGVRQGDIIVEVNRQPVRHVDDYTEALERTADATVLLLIARGEATLYVVLNP